MLPDNIFIPSCNWLRWSLGPKASLRGTAYYEFLEALHIYRITPSPLESNRVSIQSQLISEPSPKALGALAKSHFENCNYQAIDELVTKIPFGKEHLYAEIYLVYARSLACRGFYAEAREMFAFAIQHPVKDARLANSTKYESVQLELSFHHWMEAEKLLTTLSIPAQKKDSLETRLRILKYILDPKSYPLNIQAEIKNGIENNAFHLTEEVLATLMTQGQIDTCLIMYNQILPQIVGHLQKANLPKVHISLAKCHLLSNSLELAQSNLEQAKKEYTHSGIQDLQFMKAAFYGWSGKKAEALSIIADFVKNPKQKTKRLYSEIFDLCYRCGWHQEVLSYKKDVLEKFPDLAYFFIKCHSACGENVFDLIDRYRVHQRFVGPFKCEEARYYLNPCLNSFDPHKAERLLRDAISSTPQYGDSWIELLRNQLIIHGIDFNAHEWVNSITGASPGYGEAWTFLSRDTPPTVRHRALKAAETIRDELRPLMPLYEKALRGDYAISEMAIDLFAATPSYCRAIRSELGVIRIMNSYMALELLIPNRFKKSSW